MTEKPRSAEGQCTDDGPADVVLAGVRRCAASWQGDVRLLGNVRAQDIVRAIDSLPRPLTAAAKRDDIETLFQIQQWFEKALSLSDAGDDYLNGDDGRDDGRDGWDDACGLLEKLRDLLPRLADLQPEKDQ